MTRLGWVAAWMIAMVGPGCTCRSFSGMGVELEDAARGFRGPQYIEFPGGRLRLSKLEVTRVLGEPHRQPPRVIFWADGEGVVESATPVKVSYLGLERVEMAFDSGGAHPVGARFPTLAAVASLLMQRWQAQGDESQLMNLASPKYPQRARIDARSSWVRPDPAEWTIRAEPDKVLVTEIGVDGCRLSSTLIFEAGTLRFATGLVPE